MLFILPLANSPYPVHVFSVWFGGVLSSVFFLLKESLAWVFCTGFCVWCHRLPLLFGHLTSGTVISVAIPPSQGWKLSEYIICSVLNSFVMNILSFIHTADIYDAFPKCQALFGGYSYKHVRRQDRPQTCTKTSSK